MGAGLTACSSFSPTNWSSNTISVEEAPGESNKVDSIISPYQDSIVDEMAEIIARTPVDLEKGRPCSPLNNWTADALLVDQISQLGAGKNAMVLLNVGGLRGSFHIGPITKSDIFTLMPFDNEVVWVKMPLSALKDIETYLKTSGGEPISNARMNEGNLKLNIMDAKSDEFWVITSDYLMNGGDKMTFFQKKIDVVFTGVLLRDVFMRQARKEGTLQIDNTCRIDVD